MKLLFDQHLAPKLVPRLADLFPGSDHVFPLGLDRAEDDEVWNYARLHGFTIVTKDADYDALGVVRGHPPKVIWLLTGNCPTATVEARIRAHHADILAFDNDPQRGVLAIR